MQHVACVANQQQPALRASDTLGVALFRTYGVTVHAMPWETIMHVIHRP